MNKYLEYFIHFILIITALVLVNLPSFDIMIGVFQSKDLSLLAPSIIGTLINSIIFYSIILYIIPVILKEKGTRVFIYWLLLIVVVLSFIELCFDYYMATKSAISINEFVKDQILLVFLIHILTIISAIAYSFIKDWLKNEQLKKNLIKQKTAMELALLKSQVNPHFLFNALNSLFSMALKNGDNKTAEGISKLAEMMRYTLDRSKTEHVTLDEEINYIQDYIYMQKLRFEDNVITNFSVKDVHNPSLTLPAMLFMPFVENAYKYGVLVNKQSIINIIISSNNNQLNFEIENEKQNVKSPVKSNNIGLANVKEQLQLLFPNKHDLQIDNNDTFFKAHLTIELK